MTHIFNNSTSHLTHIFKWFSTLLLSAYRVTVEFLSLIIQGTTELASKRDDAFLVFPFRLPYYCSNFLHHNTQEELATFPISPSK